jgi:hypothetical protein
MTFENKSKDGLFKIDENESKFKEVNVEEVSGDTQLDSFPEGGWRAWGVVVGVLVAFYCFIAITH